MRQPLNKLLGAFVLLVVLPSLLLAFLVLRGVKRERTLREHEARVEAERAAHEIVRALDTELAQLESALARALDRNPDQVMAAEGLRKMARDLHQLSPEITDLLVILVSGEVTAALNVPLFALSPASPYSGPLAARYSPTFLSQLERGEAQESRGAYGEARRQYVMLSSEYRAEPYQGLLLNHLARVNHRLGNRRLARQAYRALLERYPLATSPSGFPLAPSARYQLIQMALETGHPEEAASEALRLYDELLGGRWPLHRSQWSLFRNLVDEVVTAGAVRVALADADSLLASLAERERQSLKTTVLLQGVTEFVWPRREFVVQGNRGNGEDFQREALSVDAEPVLVSYRSVVGSGRAGGSGGDVVVALYDR